MIVILGESGSGKTTLIKRLTGEDSKYKRIVTYTSRPRRDGEIDYVDYNFITKTQIQHMEASGLLAETMCYRGWYYGIAKKDCLDDNAIAILTPHGLRMMKKLGIPTTSIYLDVDRRSRLIKMLERGDEIEEVYRRNLTDVGEFDGVADEVDFIIKNDGFQYTADEVLEIAKKILNPPDNNVLPGQTSLFDEAEV